MVKRYFDVNVFVYYLTGHPEFADRAEYWFINTEEIYTSEITFYQLIVIISYLLKENPIEVIKKVAEALENLNVIFIHMEPSELIEIYNVSKKFDLDFEDSIHFYCALRNNCEIISNDADMKKLGAKF
jgi:predicted nucleic acid-binding protein